jgi:hypothetical protein
MGAVDERVDASLGERGNQPFDGQAQRGRAGDVADHGQLGARADSGHDCLVRLVGGRQREGHLRNDDPGAMAASDLGERVEHRVVLVVGGQDLVADVEGQRLDDGVDAAGRVGQPGQVGWLRAEQLGQRLARAVEPLLELVVEEAHRLALHPRAQLGLRLEHHPRRGTERTVVEERDLWIECPVAAKVGSVHRSSV